MLLFWIIAFISLNILLNLFTKGRLASTGIDFIVPSIILAGHEGGVIWGVFTAFIIVGAHFLTATRNLHNSPIAIVTGLVTGVGVALISADSLAISTMIGLVIYHGSSALIVFLLYRRLGIRYLFFVAVNIPFTLMVLSML